MIVLDTLELIVGIVQQVDSLQAVLAYVLRVLLHCLAVNQSAAVLTHMFATQRAIVSKVGTNFILCFYKLMPSFYINI